MSEPAPIAFPCEGLPDDPAVARLLGIYPQRQQGLFMQRVKIHAGLLTLAQWRRIADVADRHTLGTGLHLTTRQDIELHNVSATDLPTIQRALHEAGLSTVGACGDTVRNVIVCPGCGLCPDSVDVIGLANAIKAGVESLPWIRRLPRKFKISLSGCSEACGRPWVNDVGLIAEADGTFRAIVGGSLGAKPGTGIPFARTLALDEVIPFVVAALRLFEAEGDRTNRTQARLRHVRERLGNDVFLERLAEILEQEKSANVWPVPATPQRLGDGVRQIGRPHPPLGDIQPSDALELADALEAVDATLRIGFDHDLLIFGQVFPRLTKTLKRWRDGPRVIACPGMASCARAITDTHAVAGRIHKVLSADCDLTVCISGCPNGCARSSVADIGLAGCMRTIDGERTECYRVLVGGGGGKSAALAREVHAAVPATGVASVVGQIVATSDELGILKPFSPNGREVDCRAKMTSQEAT